MEVFESTKAVRRSGLPDRTRKVALHAMRDLIRAAGGPDDYDPLDHGAVVVIQPGDTPEAVAGQIGRPLEDALLEGTVAEDGHFLSCTLFSNEGGWTLVVEDADWLSPAARANLEAGLICPEGAHG